MGQKWLITGGCGFIGTNLIGRLIAEGGHAIRVLDNLTVGSRDDLANVTEFQEIGSQPAEIAPPEPNQAQLIVGDILDESLALQACKNIDVIVHLAGNTGVAPSVDDPRHDCLNNVIGTLNYLEGARQNNIQHFVFASSGAPVGTVVPPIHEEMAAHPVSPYGASKLAGEGYCSVYYQSYGVQTVCLRFSNIYGPGSHHKSSVVARFIKQVLEDEICDIYGDGEQTRDFLYIDDLIDAIIKASQLAKGGEVFQIASSQETSLNQLLDMMQSSFQTFGYPMIKKRYSPVRIGDVKRNYSDTRKARQVLNWQATTKLDNGINKTLDYFIN